MAINKILKRDNSGGGVEIQPDTYIGLLVSVIHVGTQKNEYKGVTSLVDSLALRFELQDVLTDKGTPVIVTKILRNSMKSKASLVAFGEAIGADLDEGINFDLLIGKAVNVEMGYNSTKTKVSIKGFHKLSARDRSAVKPLMNSPSIYLDVDILTQSQIKELPEWLGKVILGRVGNESDSSESSSSVDL